MVIKNSQKNAKVKDQSRAGDFWYILIGAITKASAKVVNSDCPQQIFEDVISTFIGESNDGNGYVILPHPFEVPNK